MGKLKISSPNPWNFSFEIDDNKELYVKYWSCKCPYCEVTILNPVYIYIIDSLKEAGLLDESYKLICCFCSVLKEFGLLDIKDDLCRLVYDNISDTLILRFMFVKGEDLYYVYFYVHDYSKINHWN